MSIFVFHQFGLVQLGQCKLCLIVQKIPEYSIRRNRHRGIRGCLDWYFERSLFFRDAFFWCGIYIDVLMYWYI